MNEIFAYGEWRKVWINNGYEKFWHPVNKSQYYVHRFIYEQAYGPIPKGYHIHHKDENKLNNSIDNLELVSAGDHIRSHNWGNNNRIKGGNVYWNKSANKWRAQISLNGKRKYLGSFLSKYEAYNALFAHNPVYWTKDRQLKKLKEITQ